MKESINIILKSNVVQVFMTTCNLYELDLTADLQAARREETQDASSKRTPVMFVTLKLSPPRIHIVTFGKK